LVGSGDRPAFSRACVVFLERYVGLWVAYRLTNGG